MEEKLFKVTRGDIGHASVIVNLVSKLLRSTNVVEKKDERSKFLATVDLLLPQTHLYAAFIAYCKDNTPVGIITVYRSCSFFYGGIFGTIAEVYVEPEYRSLGIGKSLLETAIQFARDKKWCKLELATPNTNITSRTADFYKTLGFIEKDTFVFINLDPSEENRLETTRLPKSSLLQKV